MGPTASKVAEWIKVEMKNLGITQTDIQRRLIGRSHGYVSERVSGKRSWGISELDSLAPLFHMQDAVDLGTRQAHPRGRVVERKKAPPQQNAGTGPYAA